MENFKSYYSPLPLCPVTVSKLGNHRWMESLSTQWVETLHYLCMYNLKLKHQVTNLFGTQEATKPEFFWLKYNTKENNVPTIGKSFAALIFTACRINEFGDFKVHKSSLSLSYLLQPFGDCGVWSSLLMELEMCLPQTHHLALWEQVWQPKYCSLKPSHYLTGNLKAIVCL